MAAYYNEIEPFAAQWLRNLITRDLIAPGDVDERSVVEVQSDDLRGYDQCHFFAGIGGWSYALRLAGWLDDRPVWTGSCPCQPFSAAGKRAGFADERHLWPDFFRLIRQCRPATVFGEQVAGAHGLAWLDLVHADLEGAGYAVAAADLPACSVGAPHRRQRLWWVAELPEQGWGEQPKRNAGANGRPETESGRLRDAGPLGDGERAGLEGLTGHGNDRHGPGRQPAQSLGPVSSSGESHPWHDLEWIACGDGKARPTQPGLFPLAHGVPGRVGRLRAYGNAIVPQVAAEFVKASIDCMP